MLIKVTFEFCLIRIDIFYLKKTIHQDSNSLKDNSEELNLPINKRKDYFND